LNTTETVVAALDAHFRAPADEGGNGE
jgi:hypothetical protein